MSEKIYVRVFFDSFFCGAFLVDKRYILQQKCLNGQIARNTLVQLLALYTNSPTLRATLHSVTERRTDDNIMPIADYTVYQYDRLKNYATPYSDASFFLRGEL